MWSFGWWTTGRDQAAVDLFEAVFNAITERVIPGKISYVFSSREPGESEFSDRLVKMAKYHGIPVVSFSAVRFRPDLRRQDRELWRQDYHKEVFEKVKGFTARVVVLAGYMWVVSPEICRKLSIINLHPAAPGGPSGTWQEVIWQLMDQKADKTGVMMHLVTSELDKGPAITYCSFPIRGDVWDSLWEQFEHMLQRSSREEIKETYGELQPLFAKIRNEGVKRELPLIVQTIRSLAKGEISIKGPHLYDSTGSQLTVPYDLTDAIVTTA
ncbi:MAG: formyl transferase [delta proteobacterium ML8_D]|jgi:phosphoribosylglycinamide formyltransferase 1|nr:MAG: formyl transferase [delta proteobacterium ML8_D]